MSGPGLVRAHGLPAKETSGQGGGLPGVLGVRREDKNKWERRAPLAPRHVRALVGQGLRVIVQPSTRRVFTDEEYAAAGAIVDEDLSDCAAIAAVKEVPVDLLLPGRTWCFFSHTIKAQPAGMPLLDATLKKKVRLIDYECITETGQRGGPRLVAFGAFAGYAGAIDFIRGLGERFLALGFSTPLLHVGSAFMYASLEEARRAVAMAGDAIRTNGLPAALCPFTVVFTGTGNVSQGALDIFRLLPHQMVDPADLPGICGGGAKADVHKLYFSIATSEHMVRRCDGGPFDKASYYAQPDKYEPIFQDTILPYSTVILNGMYWDARFPRLFTHKDMHEHVVAGQDKLLGVCDITCDADGSVPTRQFTSIEQPFFIYNALTEQTATSLDEPGVLFHAVDHLPSELPREASEHFGDCLLPFLPALAAARAPEAPGLGNSEELPPPIRGAIVAEGGQLTRDYKYIDQLRNVNHRADVEGMGTEEVEIATFSPHGVQVPPACAKLEITGHLFDTRLINRVCDLAETARAKLQILSVEVGSTVKDGSSMSVLVIAHSEEQLEDIMAQLTAATDEAKATLRRVGIDDGPTAGKGAAAPSEVAAPAGGPRRTILVLGAGFVSAPLVEYLLRRPENRLTVASLERQEVEAFARRYGARVQPEVVDITSPDGDAASAREALVRSCDLVVSLVPATLHVGIARLAIQHRKPMVTASYVSDDMQALDADAHAAGVLILNEVGLDPGIDHMSAMKMIDAAVAGGGRVLGFASLCGGLPAPEAAGSNPLGYKFSWSPKGVLLAARNAARFRKDGQLHEVLGSDLLAHAQPLTINNAFAFDVLPNRDSTSFAELYGLADAPSFFRGTLRYHGFCERMLALARLGLLEPGPRPELQAAAEPGERWSCRRWLAQLLGIGADASPEALRNAVRARLAGGPVECGLDFVAWMGLLGDQPIPCGPPPDSPIDVAAQLLQRGEMAYQPGERDMVVMRHELTVKRPSGARERHIATLIEYGEPNGATAMARTVGLTAAICAQLVLDGPERFGAGVQRPLRPEWYNPVLGQLEKEGIRLEERTETLEAEPSAAATAAATVGSGAGAAPVFAASRL